MKKRFLLVMIALLALLGIGIYNFGLLAHQGDAIAIVEKNGKAILHFDLQTITTTTTHIIGDPSAQNTIEVSPEGIAVIHADCPDQTCVKQGRRSHGPKPIVCLPHHLTIRFVDAASADLDATTGT